MSRRRSLPGCVAAGSTRTEVERLMREAVEAHVDVLRSEGLAVPRTSSFAGYVGPVDRPSRCACTASSY